MQAAAAALRSPAPLPSLQRRRSVVGGGSGGGGALHTSLLRLPPCASRQPWRCPPARAGRMDPTPDPHPDSDGSGSGGSGSEEGAGGPRRRRVAIVASLDEDAAEGGFSTSSSEDPTVGVPGLDRDPFKEDSRRHFRTVFDFSRWAAHRSTRRYRRHMLGMWQSRMVRGLAAPLLYVLALATSIATYHTLAEAGWVPEVGYAFQIRSGEPFALTSFALSLLLVFRTNASYSRWLDARKSWGQVVNRGRDLVRQVRPHGGWWWRQSVG